MDEDFGENDYGVYTYTEDGAWKLIPTVWAESGKYIIYTTDITDDGYFIIVKETGASSKSETDAPIVDEPQDEPQDVPGEVLPPATDEPADEPTESPAPVLAVLAGLGAAAVLRRK